MTDLNKGSEANLRFEQDDGAVWVFVDDSQQGTEISHLMMMHAYEYSENELRVICHHAACEIDRLRAELEKAKAQAVPETHVVVPKQPTPKMIDATWDFDEEIIEMSSNTRNEFIWKKMVEASESGAEK